MCNYNNGILPTPRALVNLNLDARLVMQRSRPFRQTELTAR